MHEDYQQLGSMDQDRRQYEAKQQQSSQNEVNKIMQVGNDFTKTNFKVKGGKGQNQSLVEDTGFVGPVPIAVTTIRLVREAEIQLRRPSLHLIPLELRTLSPRPITLVSLQGRLPNLHRLCSPAIHNDSSILRTRRLTGWRIHSPQV